MYMQYLGNELRQVAHDKVCESHQEMLQELIKLGFDKDSLPECLGGTLSHENLVQWLDERFGSQQNDQDLLKKSSSLIMQESQQESVSDQPTHGYGSPDAATFNVLQDAATFNILQDADIFCVSHQVRRQERRRERKRKRKASSCVLPTTNEKQIETTSDQQVGIQAKPSHQVRRVMDELPENLKQPPQGSLVLNVNQDRLRESVLKDVDELSDDEKAAYLQATNKCPQLIRSETNPDRYLKHAKGNSSKAAKLLVSNWKTRLALFGEERAFRPLDDLSGNGALCQEDVEFLKSGKSVLLPNDDQGRTVLLSTAAVEVVPKGFPTRYRCLFFMTHVVAERDRPAVMLRLVDPRLVKFGATKAMDIFDSFPIVIAEVRQLFVAPPGALRMYKETLAPSVSQISMSRVATRYSHSIHICESPQIMLQELSVAGFAKAGLPEALGGTWSYGNHTQWLESLHVHNVKVSAT
jgi:hypothetical protein